MTTTLVVYHANCADGLAAAWAVEVRGSVSYIAAHYGDPIPTASKDVHVVIVDFSYPQEQLLVLCSAANYVTVIDHHKTAPKPGDWMPNNLRLIVDESRSGAALTWAYFHPGVRMPELIAYVEDRDMWKWALPHSKEISAYIWLQQQTLERYGTISSLLGTVTGFEFAVGIGMTVLEVQKKYVMDAISKLECLVDDDGISYMTGNVTHDISEVGNTALKLHPEAMYTDTYFYSAGKRVHSLRSLGHDVAAIAKRHGGGGHTRAAGYTDAG